MNNTRMSSPFMSKVFYPFLKAKVLIVFFILIVFKLSLLGEGYLEDTDEMPFIPLLVNFHELISLSIEAWIYQVEVRWSTYIETLIRLPQAAVIKSYSKWVGVAETSLQALNIIGVFNVVVSSITIVLQYKILRRWTFSVNEALLGVFLISTLLNTNLYLTHVLPYDSSLLFCFFSLYIISAKELTKKRIVLSGLLCAIGFFNYYGNFPFLFIIWGVMTLTLYPNIIKISYSHISLKIRYSIIFKSFLLAIPSILLLLFLNGISIFGGFSYIDFLSVFSTSIYMGSPEETLLYGLIYFKSVEKIWGLILLSISIFSIFYIVLHREVKFKKSEQIFIVSLLVYLLYGLQGVLTGSMVFYGRVFHLFYFFIILGVLIIVRVHPRLKYALWIGAFVNLFWVHSELKSIGFPRSTMSKIGLNGAYENCTFVNELDVFIDHSYRSFINDEDFGSEEPVEIQEIVTKPFTNEKVINEKYIMKNFSFFYHYPDTFMESYNRYYPPENSELIYSKIHFMSHPAFTFEYCTREGREFFLQKSLRLNIYKLRDEKQKKNYERVHHRTS